MNKKEEFTPTKARPTSFASCIGKVTIGPLCKPETLVKLVQAEIDPRKVIQLETW